MQASGGESGGRRECVWRWKIIPEQGMGHPGCPTGPSWCGNSCSLNPSHDSDVSQTGLESGISANGMSWGKVGGLEVGRGRKGKVRPRGETLAAGPYLFYLGAF